MRSKTIELSDLDCLSAGTLNIKLTAEWMASKEIRCDIGHPMRYWEYGSAIKALQEVFPEADEELKVLDVGAGWSPLGPTLVRSYGYWVTEVEPDNHAFVERVHLNQALIADGHKAMYTHPFLPSVQDSFDVVFCISVIEHVAKVEESTFWNKLGMRVNPGGLLFITTDCMPGHSNPYVFDNLRATNYTLDDINDRVEMLKDYGFKLLEGDLDMTFHGAFVHDYTFARVAMVKQK